MGTEAWEKGHPPGAVALGTELSASRPQPGREEPGDNYPDLCPLAHEAHWQRPAGIRAKVVVMSTESASPRLREGGVKGGEQIWGVTRKDSVSYHYSHSIDEDAELK